MKVVLLHDNHGRNYKHFTAIFQPGYMVNQWSPMVFKEAILLQVGFYS